MLLTVCCLLFIRRNRQNIRSIIHGLKKISIFKFKAVKSTRKSLSEAAELVHITKILNYISLKIGRLKYGIEIPTPINIQKKTLWLMQTMWKINWQEICPFINTNEIISKYYHFYFKIKCFHMYLLSLHNQNKTSINIALIVNNKTGKKAHPIISLRKKLFSLKEQ